MIKKLSLLFLIAGSIFMTSCEDLGIDPSLSQDEVVEGLKEALRVGTDTSVTMLNKTDGYFKDQAVKILLPPEILMIQNNLNALGISAVTQPLIDQLVLKINRSAEDAASEAKPIFVNAITNMTITDGLSILNGSDSSATSYLRTNTYSDLKGLFAPKIDNSLNKPLVGNVSAASTYKQIVDKYNEAANLYNQIPFGTKYNIVNPSLGDYVTGKALSGLFIKVADEEKAIRTDPVARVTDILKKVFTK
ncbi:DUF4197 domain-containing protein [Sporocytophaga myxococcoides]|uniref:DUF4197 domain-containing protein n=1 Tax=Sporocytophaga myxococcoides TaxID=153721 RepID=UPI00048F8C94|nr:DUF4197 domain-containing protein [Sporocytophaga myxococcoides]